MFSIATLLVATLPACHTLHFSVMLNPLISAATGQHPVALRAVNRGTRTCRVRGYPRVALEDRAGRIPFVITHRGDQMVTNKPPRPVVLRPARATFVLLNNYRCDLGDKRTASVVRIDNVQLRIGNRLQRPHWCGKGDPGSTLAVSPFEPSLGATLRFG